MEREMFSVGLWSLRAIRRFWDRLQDQPTLNHPLSHLSRDAWHPCTPPPTCVHVSLTSPPPLEQHSEALVRSPLDNTPFFIFFKPSSIATLSPWRAGRDSRSSRSQRQRPQVMEVRREGRMRFGGRGRGRGGGSWWGEGGRCLGWRPWGAATSARAHKSWRVIVGDCALWWVPGTADCPSVCTSTLENSCELLSEPPRQPDSRSDHVDLFDPCVKPPRWDGWSCCWPFISQNDESSRLLFTCFIGLFY